MIRGLNPDDKFWPFFPWTQARRAAQPGRRIAFQHFYPGQPTSDPDAAMTRFVTLLYDRTVLSHPRITVAILIAILAFFATSLSGFKLDASSDSLLLEDDQDLRIFREVSGRYKVNEFLFVTVQPKGDLFDSDNIRLVGEIRDELDALDSVSSIISMLDVPLVKNVDGGLADIATNFRLLEYEDVDIERARAELTTSPIYRNLVVNPAGTMTAIQLFLQVDEEFVATHKRRNELFSQRDRDGLSELEQDELDRILGVYPALKNAADAANHAGIADVRRVIDKYRDRATIHLGGVPMIVDDMVAFIANDLLVFGTGVAVFLILMLSIIFRELRWVALPLLSCAYAGILMMGLLGLLGWNVTIISSNFVSLMLIITMSMNIHLIVRYRELMRDLPGNTSQFDLVRETMQHMVRPCLYTALTTIIAFVSLVFSEIKPVIDFGLMMTIGLVVVFATSFTLFPALLVSLPRRQMRRPEGEHYRLTEALGLFTEKHGAIVLIGTLIVAVGGLAGVQKLQVENSFINYFHKDTEIYQGLKEIDENLGGTTPLDIVLRFGESTETNEGADAESEFGDLDELFGEIESEDSDTWFTPTKVDRIKRVHDYLDSLDAVGKVLSLATVVRVAEDLNDGNEFDAFQLNVIYKRMPYVLRAAMIDPYVSIVDDEARVSVRIYDSQPDLRRRALLERIDKELQDSVGLEPGEYQLTGLLVLYNNMLQSLFKSQIQTLGVVMLGIMIMLSILFRSLKVAAIGVIPNLLAATSILGFMGWAGIPLDMMTITIAAITIGIAVDDCIHYLYRFKEEYPTIGNYTQTMHYCHANIAKAAFYTTITIVVGFSILVLSNFIPTILFGLLTAVAMIIALIAALTLMAKLILMWRPF
jgi:predicted RND superfamily exporter protein